MTALLLALAVLLDWLLGVPRRWRLQVGFGRLAAWLEQRMYAPDRWRGALAVAVLLLPPVWLAAELAELPELWGAAFSLWALWLALGHKRLHDHIRRLGSGAGENPEIALAACVSALKNGGVFGALFWFLVAGAPGALLYRLAHRLDSQWGRPHPEFGWAAANLADMMELAPAHLTALTYALLGHTRQALAGWREQAATWDNPNEGAILAAGAGALGILLDGHARAQDETHERAPPGSGAAPGLADSERALALVRHGILLWLAVIGLGALAWGWLGTNAPDWNAILNPLWESLLD